MSDSPHLEPIRHVFGLDLGQARDYSALCGLERAVIAGESGAPVKHHTARFLERWSLGTPYTKVIEDVAAITGYLDKPALVVDGTGCGRPVVEMFRAARLPVGRFLPCAIHGGLATTFEKGWAHVAKRDLVGAVQAGLQRRRLQIIRTLPDAALLATFRVKVNIATGNESFEAWREKDHDDLVFALALSVWWSENGSFGLQVPSNDAPEQRAAQPSQAPTRPSPSGQYKRMRDLITLHR